MLLMNGPGDDKEFRDTFRIVKGCWKTEKLIG